MKSFKNTLRKFKKKNLTFAYFWNEYKRFKWSLTYKFQSDYSFICRQYKKECKREIDLKNPQRFTEKLQWLKLFYRDSSMTAASDKYAVREYLNNLGYGELLNELIAVYDNVDDIDVDALPERFVLKASHGSGWNLIVKDKSTVDWKRQKRIMKSWLKQNLAWFGREWNYAGQKPRIIIEKYLEDDSGELRDFKFFCFNGEPQVLEVDELRMTNHKRLYADIEGNIFPMYDAPDMQQLKNFEIKEIHREMTKLAREISKPFPHARVDFYECNGKIYFGEITFFDSSGFIVYEPDEYDFIFGKDLELPKPNHNLDLYRKIHN